MALAMMKTTVTEDLKRIEELAARVPDTLEALTQEDKAIASMACSKEHEVLQKCAEIKELADKAAQELIDEIKVAPMRLLLNLERVVWIDE